MKKIILAILFVLILLLGGFLFLSIYNIPVDHPWLEHDLIIYSFGPVVGEVEPGESINITAILTNMGSSEVRNISVELHGLEDWNPQLIMSPPSNMLPGNSVRGVKPEAAEVVWTVTAPLNITSVENQEFEMRAYYTYSTSAVAKIRVYSENYIKSLPASKQQSKINEAGVKMEKYTDGPINVGVAVPKKIVKDDSSSIRITIDIQNIGRGELVDNELPIRISSPERNINCNINETVELLQGKSRQIRCSVDVNLEKGWDDIPIQVELENYRYWVSATSTISVKPTEV
jgi:hypothetical protein